MSVELNYSIFFHKICVNIRLISPKLAKYFVRHNLQIFTMECTEAPRLSVRVFFSQRNNINSPYWCQCCTQQNMPLISGKDMPCHEEKCTSGVHQNATPLNLIYKTFKMKMSINWTVKTKDF